MGLDRLKTRRADQSPHPGMIRYREQMLANLTGIENRLAGGGEEEKGKPIGSRSEGETDPKQ